MKKLFAYGISSLLALSVFMLQVPAQAAMTTKAATSKHHKMHNKGTKAGGAASVTTTKTTTKTETKKHKGVKEHKTKGTTK